MPGTDDLQNVAPPDNEGNDANTVPEADAISGIGDLLPTQDDGFALTSPDAVAPASAPEVAPAPAPKRSRGRPKGSKTSTGRPSLKPAASALPPPNAGSVADAGEAAKPSPDLAREAALDSAATMSANMVFNAGVFVFGEEVGKPRDKAEAAGMKLAFRDYYNARGVPNIPPEVGLALAVGAYALPRLQSEAGKTRVQRIAEKLRGAFARRAKGKTDAGQ